jgi:two-component system sensor histidine kinase AlgZ
VLTLAAGWSWAACTPLVFWLTRRLAPARVGLARSVLGHLAGWLALAAVNTLAGAGVRAALAPSAPRLPVLYVVDLDANLVAYLALVGVGHALERRGAYTRRAADALALRAELARARLLFLQRQLRPHFLFNALAAVAELAREAPAAAERTLGCLAQLLRSAAAHEGEAEVPLREDLATLAPYLEVQRIRFGDALAVTVDVPAAALDALVPSLALQPLVENAVRHGLAASGGRGRVHVSARVSGARLAVRVADNGRPGARRSPAGAAGAGRGGVGLRNTRDRLAQLYGPGHTVELAARPGGGTVAAFEVPLRHAGDPLPRRPACGRRPVRADGDAGPPVTPRVVLAFAALWLGAGAFWVVQGELAARLVAGRSDAFRHHAADMASALVWAALTPAVLALARRWPLGRGGWTVPILVHAAAALALSAAHVAAVVRLALPDRAVLHPANVGQLTLDVLIYCTLLAWASGRAFAAWDRRGELEAARLEAALAHARWRSLAVAVRPPFLLAVLTRAAALVRRDAPRAERVIECLAEVLRATLEGAARAGRTTLAEELALVRSTLALYREASGAPARLVARVGPRALEAAAPPALFRALAEALMALDAAAAGRGEAAPAVRLLVHVRAAGRGGGRALLCVRTRPPLFAAPVAGARHPDAATAVVPLPDAAPSPGAPPARPRPGAPAVGSPAAGSPAAGSPAAGPPGAGDAPTGPRPPASRGAAWARYQEAP